MARLVKGKQILNNSIDLGKINPNSPTDILFATGVVVGMTDIPTISTDLANKQYVDSVAAGLDPKESVRVATSGADIGGTYLPAGGTNTSGSFTGAPTTIDTITLANGDRVLVKDQTDAKENGIYVVVSSGVWERSTDQDGTPANEVSSGNFTFVETGTTNNSGSGWVLQGDGILTLNTDELVWVQFSESTSFSAGAGIDITSTVISTDVDDVTIINSGGTGSQLEVLKVPNALTNGTGISSLTFDGSLAATVDIANTGVVAAAYGSASSIPTFTVNAQGQLTTATTVQIEITKSQISDYDVENYTIGGELIGETVYFETVTGGTSGYSVDLSAFALDAVDNFTIDGELIGDTIYFETVTGGTSGFSVDLSALDINDTYVNQGDVIGTSGLLRYTNTDTGTFDLTGVTFDLNVGNGISASTSTVAIGGSVDIGLDVSTVQKSVPTKADKALVPTGTTGDNADTSLSIAATPTNGGYVRVSVNGVGYVLGDAIIGISADCYFSDDGGSTAKAIEDITAGDTLYWNGTSVGFDLDATDKVDFEYNILQS